MREFLFRKKLLCGIAVILLAVPLTVAGGLKVWADPPPAGDAGGEGADEGGGAPAVPAGGSPQYVLDEGGGRRRTFKNPNGTDYVAQEPAGGAGDAGGEEADEDEGEPVPDERTSPPPGEPPPYVPPPDEEPTEPPDEPPIYSNLIPLPTPDGGAGGAGDAGGEGADEGSGGAGDAGGGGTDQGGGGRLPALQIDFAGTTLTFPRTPTGREASGTYRPPVDWKTVGDESGAAGDAGGEEADEGGETPPAGDELQTFDVILMGTPYLPDGDIDWPTFSQFPPPAAPDQEPPGGAGDGGGEGADEGGTGETPPPEFRSYNLLGQTVHESVDRFEVDTFDDYFYVNPSLNFAQGETLVHVEGTGGPPPGPFRLITVQPAGVQFNPPAPITIPNLSRDLQTDLFFGSGLDTLLPPTAGEAGGTEMGFGAPNGQVAGPNLDPQLDTGSAVLDGASSILPNPAVLGGGQQGGGVNPPVQNPNVPDPALVAQHNAIHQQLTVFGNQINALNNQETNFHAAHPDPIVVAGNPGLTNVHNNLHNQTQGLQTNLQNTQVQHVDFHNANPEF